MSPPGTTRCRQPSNPCRRDSSPERATHSAVNRDHPRPSTIDHRERLWDRRSEIAPHHLRNFFQKPKKGSDQKQRATAWRHSEGEGRFLLAAQCLLLGATQK
jgi:hypothetical protein